MEKKQYIIPLTEVASVSLKTTVLTGSPADEWNMSNPEHPGAPARRTEVF